MPDELEYIVNDAIVQCDKGAKPNYFKSTYNTHIKIMGCLAATRVDKIPLVNIPEFGICAVPIAEFVTGLLPHERVIWRPFFDGLHFWPISSDAAIQAGRWRWEFARRGTALSLPDALIAAVAWRVGATVITNNLKDFTMPEISAISLR